MHVDCGTLLPGTGDASADARLRVEDGRVTAAGTREAVEAAGERVDATDRVVMPGLVDAHVHLQGSRSMAPEQWATTSTALATARATADCRALLGAGITAVRDLGSTTGLGLREAIDAGEIPGPRVFTSGRAISQTAGHGDLHSFPREWVGGGGAPGSETAAGGSISTLADGVPACRQTVRERLRAGVDCVKIMATGGVLSERDRPEHSQFADAELEVLVAESHRAGVPVAAHAQGSDGVKRALRAGVDTIEHGFYLDSEAVDLLCNRGAVLVPTLAIMHRIVEYGEEYLPAFAVEKAAEAYEAHVESIRRAHEGGVRIAAGTDFIGPDLVPHGENPLELELLVSEIGLSPAEAVVAATGTAGRALPARDVGPLTEGNVADFLVLEPGADPHSSIGDVRRVAEVFTGGQRVEDI